MTDYKDILAQAKSLTDGIPHTVSNMANISALLGMTLENINWAGFYTLEGDRLILGPFSGKPACIEIPLSKGVCGMAAREDKTVVVADVHSFPGHIACDEASASEIVIPLHRDGSVWGVLDIDSPVKDRFSSEDKAELELIAKAFEDTLLL